LLVLLQDVTELRRLEAIRTDFAANVSHELRTPITNISGYVDTLLQVGLDDREQARGFLQTVKRNADRLASIVEDLLALARLEQPDSKAWLEPQSTLAADIIAGAVAEFEDAAAAKQIEIRVAAAKELRVMVNPRLAEQAVGNLVSNAVRYSASGTRVTITARAADSGFVELAVADEGSGIEARHVPRLFERFYRVDRARSRQMGGTGLGLAIVKHIAQVHGGRVTVESEVGRGSVFRLSLPRSV
jgi:two-component system phosphate regulon sensor histidine kinase PhoR